MLPGIHQCASLSVITPAMIRRTPKNRITDAASPKNISPTMAQAVAAHLKSTRNEPADAMKRMASLVAALKETNTGLSQIESWYRSRGLAVEASCPDDIELRTAFLAAEGAFFVRYLVGLNFSEEAWNSTFDALTRRIERLLPESKV
jgi:hypothetical protein